MLEAHCALNPFAERRAALFEALHLEHGESLRGAKGDTV